MIKRTVFFAFALACFNNVSAQYRITGNVIDVNSEAIYGMTVSAELANDTIAMSPKVAITDGNGNYEVRNLLAGEYTVRYEMLGFSGQQHHVSLSGNVVMDTVRMAYDTQHLAEIVVKGELLSMYGARETRLFTESERERSASGLELMQNLPQITINTLANKLTTLDGKSVLILRNGIKIDEADLMATPPGEIVQVEYYSRPPAKYLNMGVDAILIVTMRKSRETGGYLIANLRNGLTTGYGTNILQGKQSFGNNDLAFRYFIDYRNLNKNRLEQTYGGVLNGKRYEIDKKGLNSDYRGEYHIFEGTYSHVKDNMLFNAKAKMVVNPGVEGAKQNTALYIEGEPSDNFISDLYISTKTFSPSLDLYLSRKMSSDQEISFNVVNTFHHIASDRVFSQTSDDTGRKYDAVSHTQNNSYSLIAETDYSKTFGDYSLSSGIRNMYKTIDENFTAIQNVNRTTNSVNNLYYYIGLSGKVESINFSLDLGGEHTMLRTNGKYNFFTVRPSLYVSYQKKASRISLNSTIQTRTPDMSVLSGNPISIDSLLISYGNSGLKPYRIFANALTYTLNKPSFYFQTSAQYFLIHKPYRLAFVTGDNVFEKIYTQPDNNENALKYLIQFSWKPVGWLSVRPYYSIEYQWHDMGGMEYDNWLNYASLSVAMSYKRLSLNMQAVVQSLSLEGTILSRSNNVYTGDLTWKKDRLSLTLGCIFSNSPSRLETYSGSAVSYMESKRWDDFKGLTYLQCVYTLPWGKDIQRKSRQTLNNSDTDSGMSMDNKAKQ